MIKRSLLGLLIVFLIILSACSGGSDASGENDGDTEISFWTISLSPTFDDYINGMIEEFESQNDGIKVKWQDVPVDSYSQKLSTSAASDSLPDVMNLDSNFLREIADLGALTNLDDKVDDVKDEYFEGAWKASELEGSIYAIPWYLSSGVMMYNKGLLEESGFDSPPSKTEEEWEMSKVIKDKTGSYGASVTDFHLQLLKDGVSLVSDDYKTAAFNTSKTLEIFKTYKERYDNGLIPDDLLLGQTDVIEAYANKDIAWFTSGPQRFREVDESSSKMYDQSDVAPTPVGENNNINMHVQNIGVFSNTDHEEEAIKFAKFITNAENQLEFSKLTPILPSIKEATNDDFFAKGKDSEDLVEKARYYAVDSLDHAESLLPPVNNLSDINKAIDDALRKVLMKDEDPEKALDEAEEQVNTLLNEE